MFLLANSEQISAFNCAQYIHESAGHSYSKCHFASQRRDRLTIATAKCDDVDHTQYDAHERFDESQTVLHCAVSVVRRIS